MKFEVNSIKSELMDIYNFLHNTPEMGWKEYKTTKYIKDILEEKECNVVTFDNLTGVLGTIGNSSPTIGIRADMDAVVHNVNGISSAIHSCGHDAHMTIILGVLLLFRRNRYVPKGRIKFIFQPAEEKGTGALEMVRNKVVEDVDYLYGVHLRPINELRTGEASPSISHGASCLLSGNIRGEDAHGARPHLGKSSILIGQSILEIINKIHLDPLIPHSIKMTQFNTGNGSINTISGSATFSLDIRSQSNKGLEILIEKVFDKIRFLSSLYEVDIELYKKAYLPAAEIDKDAEKIMSTAIVDVLGVDKLQPSILSPGGDDFHFYTYKKPKIKGTMLGLGCDLKPGLHHPNMNFNKEMIFKGIEILAIAIDRTFNQFCQTNHLIEQESH